MATMTTQTLDLAYGEDTLAEAQARIMEQYRVWVEVVNEHGPAGNWPEVRLMGEVSDIATFLFEQYQTGDAASDLATFVYLMGGGIEDT